MPIKRLPEKIIHALAAGEVIEHPASVVKELISNSLDAGADDVRIYLMKSGLTRIIVEDNGNGIDPDDIPLALQTHTTSKVTDNINNISTLGFRGEALSSIAFAARVTLMSKKKREEIGWKVSAAFGRIEENIKPCVLKNGTRVEVSDIFAAYPARLRFLKSERVELGRIRNIVQEIAVAHPHVTFALHSGNKTIIDQMGVDNSVDERKRLSYLTNNFFAERAIEVPLTKDNGYSLSGWISLPNDGTKSSRINSISINGHPIKDRMIAKTIKSAVKNSVGKDTEVDFIIRFCVDPDLIDVNTHPKKEAIRFRDEDKIKKFLRESVDHVIKNSGFSFAADLSGKAKALAFENEGNKHKAIEEPLGKAFGQAHKAWIISETATGIAVIDQHAAHERITLERLKASLQKDILETHPLPSPILCDLSYEEVIIILEYKDRLHSLGVEFNEFDSGGILVSQVPSLLLNNDIRKLMADLAKSLLNHEDDLRIEPITEKLAMAACRASIKVGDSLSPDEVNAFLRAMEKTPNATRCIHGRPSVIFLDNDNLEKLFDRK